MSRWVTTVSLAAKPTLFLPLLVPTPSAVPTAPTYCATIIAICVHGNGVKPDQYLNTEPFMDAIKETFDKKRAGGRAKL